MAKSKFLRLAVLAALTAAGAAHAGTGSLTVNATITPACKFTALPAMNFTIDPSLAGPITATSAVKYKCTKGTPAGTFAVGGVTNGTTGYSSGAGGALVGTGGNTDTLQFGITWPAITGITGTGFGAGGNEETINLTGSIAASQYQAATPDSYTGSVTLTINP